VLPILTGDLGEMLRQCAAGTLGAAPKASGESCVAIVLAAPGYPDDARGGGLVHGIERAQSLPGVRVFQAGTRACEPGLVASGGRVLTVSATAATREEARERAYGGLAAIELEGGQWRADIAGAPALLTRRESA
jgi:phosphoribosylamine--glycine ligase